MGVDAQLAEDVAQVGVDGVLVATTALAYVLCRGRQAWRGPRLT